MTTKAWSSTPASKLAGDPDGYACGAVVLEGFEEEFGVGGDLEEATTIVGDVVRKKVPLVAVLCGIAIHGEYGRVR